MKPSPKNAFLARLLLCLSACFVAFSLHAHTLPQPEGEPLLTVTGAIQHTNQGDQAVFDRALLQALKQRTTSTATPWTEGTDQYTGPLGRALVEAVGAQGASRMTVTALNDYQAEVPVSDFMTYDIILAMQKNGRNLRIRDRGPLFIIYPFNEHPHLHTEMHYNRSVWQVKAIEFHP